MKNVSRIGKVHTIRTKQSGLDAAMQGIKRVVIWFGTAIARIIRFLTTPPGSAIVYGFAAIILTGISAEVYWLATPGHHHPFIPKPFINDRASLVYLSEALSSQDFWMATFFCLIVLSTEAMIVRQIPLAVLKARFQEVANERVPLEGDEEGYLKLRAVRLRAWRNYGMRQLRMKAGLIFLVFSVDIVLCWHSFPLYGVPLGQWFVNLVWFMLALFGAESMIAMFTDVLSPVELPQEVEVIS